MSTTFHPPGVGSLTEIDRADVTYKDNAVIIDGLVSMEAQAGSSGINSSYMVHSLSFAAWHRLGEPVVKRELVILRAVPKGKEFFNSDHFGDFPKLSIQRFRVLLSEDEKRAVFQQALPVDDKDDEELMAVREGLRQPVVVPTKIFGDLVLNREVNWFEGTAQWNGTEISITIDTDEGLDITKQLATAEALFQDQEKWAKKVAEFAVREKLALANDWRPEGKSPITASEFLTRMKLVSISIETDCEFEFWHDDDDMFAGHSITVYGSLDKGIIDSDIPG